jgi:hypothetical protein
VFEGKSYEDMGRETGTGEVDEDGNEDKGERDSGGGIVGQMKKMLEMLRLKQERAEKGGKGKGGPEAMRVILEEKYFRRNDKFEDNVSKFRPWVFDLLVSVGQVDQGLHQHVLELFR